MKLHRNAKSTPSTRLIMVQRVLREGWSYADAAEGFAVSVRTVAKWVRRCRDGGLAALEDASSRPGRPPHQTPAETVTAIRAWREAYGIPAWRSSRAVGVPTSTVGAWLRRLGLSRPPVVAGPPVQRYEWPRRGGLGVRPRRAGRRALRHLPAARNHLVYGARDHMSPFAPGPRQRRRVPRLP